MHQRRNEELRTHLEQLLQKQAEFLDSKSLGGASDTELLEYELRQHMIHDIYEELAHRWNAPVSVRVMSSAWLLQLSL